MNITINNKRYIFNYRRFISRILVVIMVISLIVIALSINGNFFSNAGTIQKYDLYKVREGDTLWSIADKYLVERQDIRELIYDIKVANSMNSSVIFPNQLLQIPLSDY